MTHHPELLCKVFSIEASQLVLTLFTTSPTKAFTFSRALDFQMKFVGIKGTKMVEIEKPLNDNNPTNVKD